jgi:predicted nucleotidyltransferase
MARDITVHALSEIEHDIEVIRRWAAANPIVERVHIFGSRVRGTHRPDSDLDVAIEHGVMPGDADHFTTAIGERSTWADELQALAKCKLDVWSYRPGDTPKVEAGIRESSVVVYERAI